MKYTLYANFMYFVYTAPSLTPVARQLQRIDMTPIGIVTKPEQVLKNIQTFQEQVKSNGGDNDLASKLSQFRAWYATKARNSQWIFGPSKFVGYTNQTAEWYGANAQDMNGRTTENALKAWFSEVGHGPERDELFESLRAYLAQFGRAPSAAARISIRRQEAGSPHEMAGADSVLADALLTIYRVMPEQTRQEFRRRMNKEA